MTIPHSIKQLANAQLSRYGQILATESTVASFERFVLLLRRAKIMPRTAIGIGVADGTPWLYRAFPNAKYYLIDPTRESVHFMQQCARQLDAEVINVALAETEGEMIIEVWDGGIGASSLFEEIGPYGRATKYPVPVR